MKKIKYNTKYAKITGTFYHQETPIIVCNILEESRVSRNRIRIHYGDVKTGKLWGDVETCRVGRSTGEIKIPLAIKTSRSYGGGAILDHCIVKIEHANKRNGGIIYDITK